MPRKTRRTVLVETPTEPEKLPTNLTRQGTFTKTPDDSCKMDLEEQKSLTPPRATRGRTRKTKKSGSPPMPTRTMPRRGRKQVQFAEDPLTIPEEVQEVHAVKENIEPSQSADSSHSSPAKEPRKKTRRTKKAVVIPSDPEPSSVVVEEGTRSPDNDQSTSNAFKISIPTQEESSHKPPRKRNKSKENPTNPQTSKSKKEKQRRDVSETRCGSPQEKVCEDYGAPEEPSANFEGTKTAHEEPYPASEESSTAPGKSKCSGLGKRSKEEPKNPKPLVREGTFTRSPENDLKQDKDGSEIRSESLSPSKRRSGSSFTAILETDENEPGNLNVTTPFLTPEMPYVDQETSGSPVSERRSTFTKTPLRKNRDQETNCTSVSQRRATFTKTTPQSKRPSWIQTDQENVRAELNREGTFTKSSGKESVKESDETGQIPDVDPPELKREGTFTKSPEKEDTGSIPDFQASVNRTPGIIENLSVFQRLSAKIPLSERRSLVSSERKRSQLSALREARKNHLTPKSITFERRTSHTTPLPTVTKTASSSKRPKSAVKKPPNFAAIHERNFAKMESLLENKKRLRERANFLMSPTRPTQTSGIPKLVKKVVEPVANEPSGKKKSQIPIMKMAAKERLKAAVANKCTTGALLKSQNSKVLKGVRTNKRFELLLKQKNIKM